MEFLQNLENHHFIAMMAFAVIAIFAIDALQSANSGAHASYTIITPGPIAEPANNTAQMNRAAQQNTSPANATKPANKTIVPVNASNASNASNGAAITANNSSDITLANASNTGQANTSAGNTSTNDRAFPEPTTTTTENLTADEPAIVTPKPSASSKVTYYFFWASYCGTCRAMMPMIEDVAKKHPKLNVQMIDVHSGSSYLSRFGVTMTAVSVIVREEGGKLVSGTKTSGFMNERQIEALICTELDDDRCDNVQ